MWRPLSSFPLRGVTHIFKGCDAHKRVYVALHAYSAKRIDIFFYSALLLLWSRFIYEYCNRPTFDSLIADITEHLQGLRKLNFRRKWKRVCRATKKLDCNHQWLFFEWYEEHSRFTVSHSLIIRSPQYVGNTCPIALNELQRPIYRKTIVSTLYHGERSFLEWPGEERRLSAHQKRHGAWDTVTRGMHHRHILSQRTKLINRDAETHNSRARTSAANSYGLKGGKRKYRLSFTRAGAVVGL